jgi:hypothetical protein
MGDRGYGLIAQVRSLYSIYASRLIILLIYRGTNVAPRLFQGYVLHITKCSQSSYLVLTKRSHWQPYVEGTSLVNNAFSPDRTLVQFDNTFADGEP